MTLTYPKTFFKPKRIGLAWYLAEGTYGPDGRIHWRPLKRCASEEVARLLAVGWQTAMDMFCEGVES